MRVGEFGWSGFVRKSGSFASLQHAQGRPHSKNWKKFRKVLIFLDNAEEQAYL